MSHLTSHQRQRLFTTLSVLALATAIAGATVISFDMGLVAPAYAASSGNGSGGGSGGGGSGGGSSSGSGGQTDGGNGGPGEDSDGVGPRAGDGDESAGDGAPSWASEGIPEIELGRLNVARSPDQVLERALEESLAELANGADFYNLTHDQMVYVLDNYFDKVPYIDSPLQNLALYDAYLNGGDPLADLGVDNDVETLLAAFLGTASDKTVPITVETVEALAVIFEVEMTDAEMQQVAEDAEEIRLAILEGHG